MKFPLAYYLMLIYLTVIFKPLIPVISDAYSHVFGEAIHLATVHAKYGSNHLEKTLAKNNENNNNHQKSISYDENFAVHLSSSNCSYEFHLVSIGGNYSSRRFYKLAPIFLPTIVPPPDC